MGVVELPTGSTDGLDANWSRQLCMYNVCAGRWRSVFIARLSASQTLKVSLWLQWSKTQKVQRNIASQWSLIGNALLLHHVYSVADCMLHNAEIDWLSIFVGSQHVCTLLLSGFYFVNKAKTRMHSSRMRTVRCSAPMHAGIHRGVCPNACLDTRGVSAKGGVCPNACWDTQPPPPWTE